MWLLKTMIFGLFTVLSQYKPCLHTSHPQVRYEVKKTWNRHLLRRYSTVSVRSSRAFSSGGSFFFRDRNSISEGGAAKNDSPPKNNGLTPKRPNGSISTLTSVLVSARNSQDNRCVSRNNVREFQIETDIHSNGDVLKEETSETASPDNHDNLNHNLVHTEDAVSQMNSITDTTSRQKYDLNASTDITLHQRCDFVEHVDNTSSTSCSNHINTVNHGQNTKAKSYENVHNLDESVLFPNQNVQIKEPMCRPCAGADYISCTFFSATPSVHNSNGNNNNSKEEVPMLLLNKDSSDCDKNSSVEKCCECLAENISSDNAKKPLLNCNITDKIAQIDLKETTSFRPLSNQEASFN